ncbi:unnamed protein product [Lactuca virosa]|uniref:R13L1/DRL21-like LRR repeat region domain-containing protein n=1 Tax=Lactuca virosa TaxID=75947 RepID=A0AAU9NS84_9ASTR|nr:unnamed protein product [Lactuca virosa]
MEWSDTSDVSQNEMIDYEVLKELRPHPNLKNLKIVVYKGTRFPSWVGDPLFDRTELTLCGCKSTHLPTLGILRSHKKLVVKRMNEVKTVGFEYLHLQIQILALHFHHLKF